MANWGDTESLHILCVSPILFLVVNFFHLTAQVEVIRVVFPISMIIRL